MPISFCVAEILTVARALAARGACNFLVWPGSFFRGFLLPSCAPARPIQYIARSDAAVAVRCQTHHRTVGACGSSMADGAKRGRQDGGGVRSVVSTDAVETGKRDREDGDVASPAKRQASVRAADAQPGAFDSTLRCGGANTRVRVRRGVGQYPSQKSAHRKSPRMPPP